METVRPISTEPTTKSSSRIRIFFRAILCIGALVLGYLLSGICVVAISSYTAHGNISDAEVFKIGMIIVAWATAIFWALAIILVHRWIIRHPLHGVSATKEYQSRSERMIRAVVYTAIAGVALTLLGAKTNNLWMIALGVMLGAPLFFVYPTLCALGFVWSITSPIWYPFFSWAAGRRGAPWNPGDIVRITRGMHKGRITHIHDVWDERGEVRVFLGEMEREEVVDVLNYLSVRRVAE